MPSKVLVEVANAYHTRKHYPAMGIGGEEGLSVDTQAVQQYVRRLRNHFVGGVLGGIDQLGERNLAGQARFMAPNVLEVNSQRLQAKAIIIATGSSPIVPKPWRSFGDLILTSDEIFELEELPRHLAVIGLGGVGIELAQALARLGVQVYGFEMSQRVAGLSDQAVSAEACNALGKDFTLYTGTAVELQATGNGVIVRAQEHQTKVDKVLVALGRRPNVQDLGLEHLGIDLDDQGLPSFDPCTLQVGDLPIYIAGDVDSYRPLLHEASDEGFIAGYNAVRDQATSFSRRVPLGIFFSDPNIAIAGTRREQLVAADHEFVVGEVDLANQGRLRMSGRDQGRIHIYADRGSGQLLGAEICAPAGEHLAHLLAWAIQQEMSVADLLRMPFYHPVVEESLRTAFRHASRQVQPHRRTPELNLCDRLPFDAMD